MNPQAAGGWQREVHTETLPEIPELPDETIDDYVRHAMRMRPEINQARLAVQRNDLEIVRTRNGLLPRLDLFITLGRTGYADSFGESWRDFASGNSYDVLGGLALEIGRAHV